MNSENVLIRIINLKMYFPVKKGVFLKANDDITLDIYADETLGLVGESGCGKSTLGRTILQLYQQTGGKTMYYGRTLDEVAPQYVRDTLKNLPKRVLEMKKLEKILDQEIVSLETISGQKLKQGKKDLDIPEDHPKAKEIYKQINHLNELNQKFLDTALNIAQIVGGFLVADDLTMVSSMFLKKFDIIAQLEVLNKEDEALSYQFDEYTFEINDDLGKEDKQSIQAKLNQIVEQKNAKQAQKERYKKELEAIKKEIDLQSQRFEGLDEFKRWQAHLDNGIDLARLNYEEMRRMRRDLQLIFQDPYSSLNPRLTVGQIIGEGLKAHGIFKKNNAHLQAKVMSVMEECGLAPYMVHRYPHQFSGGQRQRIGIARSLALRPKFVVCDEAVSALDVSIQSQILNLLLELREKENLTYLFISHDLSVIKYISDRIAVMYLGNLVELAPTESLFKNFQHPYTQALLRAIPTTDPDATVDDENILEGDIPSPVNSPKGCKFHTRCKYATDVCKIIPPLFEQVAEGHFVACHHQLGKQASER